jgi:hypothetical protein
MRSTLVAIAVCAALVFGGCVDKEKEIKLQAQLDSSRTARTSLQMSLDERNQFVEEILKSVNDIYADLQTTRLKEKELIPKGSEPSEIPWGSSANTRARFIQSINEIGVTLKDNRKKISDLQARVRAYRGEVTNLTALIDKLKTSLQEREESIAQLTGRVNGLEQTVADQVKLVSEKERVIDDQKRTINKVFYVAGTRRELKDKGIITNEGGFLWGLLGSTTTLASDLDTNEFIPLDRNADQTIHLAGKIDEILPHRKATTYAADATGETSSDLKILEPSKFWQGNYLVVVLD